MEINQDDLHKKITLNQNHRDYDFSISLVDLLELQVLRTPQAIALVTPTENLNFTQLWKKIKQLTQYLLSLSIKPQNFIGIALPRSSNQIIALFAILNIRAIFVPLDPDYPISLLQYMIQDSGVQFILTDQHNSTHFTGKSIECILVDDFFANNATTYQAVTTKNKITSGRYYLFTLYFRFNR